MNRSIWKMISTMAMAVNFGYRHDRVNPQATKWCPHARPPLWPAVFGDFDAPDPLGPAPRWRRHPEGLLVRVTRWPAMGC